MRRVALITVLLLQMPLICQGAPVYEWKDSRGVLHFTDNIKNVPNSYRDKVRVRDFGPPEPSPQGAPGGAVGGGTGGAPGGSTAPAQTLPSVVGKPSGDTYGGRTGLWWRSRFETARTQIATLQNGLSAKQQRLTESRRRHVIFQRPKDRVASNELAAEIDKDQARITELQEELKILQQEADRAGVPAEWR
ncbi:DUF4124 domain-containing protein [Geomonas sp. RF6]|uniref:DUF4124 domain-containing protein n=1 Tax=Geomonas sp. RF6 TaxID=2897342 RepID=UPI001E3782A1|nr:DUF4124 domain-containing protein [Geomonas sp. RF6]UFS69827.1 DUF4124 domain-containing protein [Geomonas sp. RF6]